MKKMICLFLIGLVAFGSTVTAQSITMPADSVSTLLCKTWEVDYVMMGGMKIGRQPGAAEINYEFKTDKTFLLTGNRPGSQAKGVWSYDPIKKLIKLTSAGKSKTNIISLTGTELVMLADTKEATPDDPSDMKMVFKVKAK